MNELSIFAPDKVSPSCTPGRHKAVLSGGAIYPDQDELMLLHYKFIDFERTFKRQQALNERLGDIDRSNRWGYQYARTRDETRAEWDTRSEEHTSELQSLMRISYAVFCLKKKKEHSKLHIK